MSVDELGWNEFGLALSYLDGPAGVVDDGVVVSAEHDAVVEGCVAAVFPFGAVVDVAPGGWAVAAG
ncbi:MAG TPA: hypothetical protein VL595_30135, partial [Pseudonocardia sp.]|nr:hypothetical protein [Pseudonocardia sp.]